ncbi:MAG: hypothetical protein WKF84_02155 [Pyrinomonadaceae bacterium]
MHTMLNLPASQSAEINLDALKQATQDFVIGGSELTRSLRQLYAADLLVEKNVAPQTAVALIENAVSGVESALDAPHATVAVLAE